MPGRPTKYDDAKANQIATLLRGGCTRKDASASVGVHYTTFLNWIERYPQFLEQVETAEGFAAVKMTTILMKAAEKDWKAALEFLKRRRRDEWGDNLSLSRLSDEDVIAIAEGRVPGTDPPGSAGRGDPETV